MHVTEIFSKKPNDTNSLRTQGRVDYWTLYLKQRSPEKKLHLSAPHVIHLIVDIKVLNLIFCEIAY
jgi:hypothetical protein